MRCRLVILASLAGSASACLGASSEQAAAEGSADGDAGASSSTTATTQGGAGTGSALEGCGENLLEDPGFESGTPSAAWVEASPLFGTPICSADCTPDVGAGPFVGDWWVWFGGVARADSPSVGQDVVIPEGRAVLRFGFSLNAGAGSGNDVFSVSIDDQTLLAVSDAEVSTYGGWRIVELDVSSFADGGQHALAFSATIAGAGVTNFFVDEVELLPCDAAAGSSGTTGPAGTGTGTGTGTG